MATRYSEGGVTVELDDTLERFVLAAVDAALPGVRTRLEAEVANLLEEAREEWPVRTGVSRDGLKTVTEIGPSYVRVLLVNDVDYAKFVRPSKWYGATTAWERLCKKPMKDLGKRMVIELGPEVVAALRRGRS